MDLTLPALIVLISFPGFGHKSPTPRMAAVADSVPVTWRPVSRLALENDFVLARLPEIVHERGGMKVGSDPRTLRVSVDATTGTLSAEPLVGTVPVGAPLRVGLDAYSSDLSQRNFQRVWQKRSVESINTRVVDGVGGTGG